MNYSEQIFKMLDIEPDEEFRFSRIEDTTYRIRDTLGVEFKSEDKDYWKPCGLGTFPAILTGELEIVKIPKITPEDKIAIEYAKLCGCKWLAKDLLGGIYGFTNKPYKTDEIWDFNSSGSDSSCVQIDYPISFLSWDDKEPYYIGD